MTLSETMEARARDLLADEGVRAHWAIPVDLDDVVVAVLARCEQGRSRPAAERYLGPAPPGFRVVAHKMPEDAGWARLSWWLVWYEKTVVRVVGRAFAGAGGVTLIEPAGPFGAATG
jgi:hypothetical protein